MSNISRSGGPGGIGGTYGGSSVQDDWDAINREIDYASGSPAYGYGTDTYDVDYGREPSIAQKVAEYFVGPDIAQGMFGGPWGITPLGPMIGIGDYSFGYQNPLGPISNLGGGNQPDAQPNSAAMQQPQQPTGFQLNPLQVQQDLTGWGGPYPAPQMNPLPTYGGVSTPFSWGNYFGNFGGK